jgi:hypothetical protein
VLSATTPDITVAPTHPTKIGPGQRIRLR